MRKKLNALQFRKEKIAKLNEIKGGADFPIIIITAQRTCFSLVGHYTCETGLHETCDHSFRICPIDI